jgi:hypothetical protein
MVDFSLQISCVFFLTHCAAILPKCPEFIATLAEASRGNLPEILTGSYKPKSKYLLDGLPESAPGILDLRLLGGDLDDENASSPSLTSLKTLVKSLDSEIILLLAGSGFGKTKTIFDFAAQEYALLFDASQRSEVRFFKQRDFQLFFKAVEAMLDTTVSLLPTLSVDFFCFTIQELSC